MDRGAYLEAVAQDSAALAASARLGLDPSVDRCPGWTVRSVLEHLGTIHLWVHTMVKGRLAERLPRGHLAAPPADGDELIAWFESGAARLVEVLGSVEPDEPVWNWSLHPHVAAFWPRRMAHETAVHRWDSQRAHGKQQPVDGELAVDGIDEVFDTIVPRLVEGSGVRDVAGSLHLHCTDREGEWLVSLRDGVLDVRREHAKGDCAVRGTSSDLLLLLVNRPTRDEVQVFGDEAVLAAWSKFEF